MDTLSKLFEELVEVCEYHQMDSVGEFNSRVSLIREIIQIKQQEINRLVDILSSCGEDVIKNKPTVWRH